MSTLRRRRQQRKQGRGAAAAALALALAAIVGLVSPLAVSAEARAGEGAGQSAVEQGGADPGADSGGADEPATDATGADETGTDGGEPGAEVPGSEDLRRGAAGTAKPGGPPPSAPAAPGRVGLSWRVVDEADVPVAGATVKFEGPRASSANTWASWGAVRTVTDCVAAPCAATSMDQDPREGVFAVDRLVAGNSVTLLTDSATRRRFRITPLDTPAGYSWVSAAVREIPPLSASQPGLPSPNPWASPTYDFGDLRVTKPALSCAVDNVYSISSNGQLKHVTVDPGRTSGAVSNVGSPAPGPGVGNYNGLAIGSDGTEVYAFNRGYFGGRVFRYDVARGSWQSTGMDIAIESNELTLVGGAMDPSGTYWAGGYRGSSGFELWAMNREKTGMVPRGRVDLSEWDSQNENGDFAFDAAGNLFILRGLNVGHDLDIFRVDAKDLAAGTGTQLIPVSAKLPTAESPFQGVSGIAFDPRGALFLGALQGFGFVTLPLSPTAPQELSLRGVALSSTDLATCGFPPTVRLQKDLPDGRATATDQFALELRSGGRVIGSGQTRGSASGVQPGSAGPNPVTSGASIALAETPVSQTRLGAYASSWACVANGVRIAGGPGPAGSVTIPEMPRGGEVLCTIKNTIAKAQKTATPASGTAVDGSSVVRYQLSVDNSAGEGPVAVDYWDALADVLDDAVFANSAGAPTAGGVPDVGVSGGISFSAARDWDAVGKWLRMRGTVAAGATGTLSFSVLVRPNSVNADARRAAETTRGFLLRNWLVPGNGGDAPPVRPTACAPGMCTEHPVKAWTVSKGSVPASGAVRAKGGSVHYSVAAEKVNADTPLTGLVLQDDLTHVFKTAGWAPGATTPANAKPPGVYLLNAAGRSIGLDGAPNTSTPGEYLAVREVGPPERRNVAAPGGQEDQRWIVTSGAPLDLPRQAVRAEMWFAVQAGVSPEGIPDPADWAGEGKRPVTGWRFVNYATGIARSGSSVFAPNACVTGEDVPDTTPRADAPQPVDTAFPARCRVDHQYAWNSFTIRKDAGGLGVAGLAGRAGWGSDPTGLWNMAGQVFEIRDSVAGRPSAYPSVRLCRTDYSPANGWDGAWLPAAQAADASRWDFNDAASATQRGILDWNALHPADTRPVCGTISEIAGGKEQGRWRSEGLGEGEYWLVETRAPNAQVNPATLERRDVPGVQRLAEAIPFTVWPVAAGEAPGGGGPGSERGRGQVDIGRGPSQFVGRCDPSSWVADRPTACVDRTGYFVVVKDPSPATLPFTGGRWLGPLLGAGTFTLLVALACGVWWRRGWTARGGSS